MSRQERQMDYQRRVRNDLDKMLMEYGVSPLSMSSQQQYHDLLEELTDVSMFYIEHLLIEATT